MEENKNIIEEQVYTEPPFAPSGLDPATDPSMQEILADLAATEDVTPEEPPKKKKKAGRVLGIIFGSLAVVIIGLVLFFILKDNKDLTRGSFIREIGGVSETYLGAVSERTYSSADDAAEDFVYEEVVGDSYATITSVTSLGSADKSEHNIPDEFLQGSQTVEKVEVEFTVPAEASLKRRVQLVSYSNEGTEAKVVVYVIKYEMDWKYFAPLPETGDTISKSYYDSVFDNAKYQNCTYEVNQTVTSSSFGIVAAEFTIHQIFKFADGKIYIEQTQTSKVLGQSETETLYFYAEELENGDLLCYIKENGGSWQSAELHNIGFYSLEELTPFYDQYLDYTYFEKTDYGFDLPKENAKIFYTDYLYRELQGLDLSISRDDIDVDMYAEYFVREGQLSGMRINSGIDMRVEEDGIGVTVNVKLNTISKVTDYGTTVVECPVNK